MYDSSGNRPGSEVFRSVPRSSRRDPMSVFLPQKREAELQLSEAFMSFLRGCLRYDMEERMTAQDMLKHPFLQVTNTFLHHLLMLYLGMQSRAFKQPTVPCYDAVARLGCIERRVIALLWCGIHAGWGLTRTLVMLQEREVVQWESSGNEFVASYPARTQWPDLVFI